MALIACPECGAEISDGARACPHCGFPLKEEPPVAFSKPRWGFHYRSKAEILGLPLLSVAVGRDPRTGKLLVAKGIIAVGQFGVGFITFAQFGVGFLFGFGQFMAGFAVVAQFALGAWLGLGQFSTGLTAVGQVAVGRYVLCQEGWGEHVWSARQKDPQAEKYFRDLWNVLRNLKAPAHGALAPLDLQCRAPEGIFPSRAKAGVPFIFLQLETQKS